MVVVVMRQCPQVTLITARTAVQAVV